MRGMSPIVKTVTALTSAFMLLYGIHTVLYGHSSPGGGFCGGVILACVVILMVLAFGKDFVRRILAERTPSIWGSVGALGFLSVALLGYVGGSFFRNFVWRSDGHTLLAAGTILPSDISVAILVAASLAGAFLALSVFRPEGPSDED